MAADGHKPEIDRVAVAEQVIVSAGKILAAAGFHRDEIGEFFRQAADQLAGADAAPNGGIVVSASPPRPVRYQLNAIRAEFNTIPPVAELMMLQARAEAIDPSREDSAAIDGCLDLAMDMVPHIGAAQEWLRGMAEQKHLTIVAGRSAAEPSGQEGNGAGGVGLIYLEDLEAIYRPALDLVDRTFQLLGRHGQNHAFQTLLATLADNCIVITTELKKTIETWVEPQS